MKTFWKPCNLSELREHTIFSVSVKRGYLYLSVDEGRCLFRWKDNTLERTEESK